MSKLGCVEGSLLPTLTLQFLNMLLADIRLLPLSLVFVLVFTTSVPVLVRPPLGVKWQPIRIWYLLGTIPAFPLLETNAVPRSLWQLSLLIPIAVALQVPSWPRTLVVPRTVPLFT